MSVTVGRAVVWGVEPQAIGGCVSIDFKSKQVTDAMIARRIARLPMRVRLRSLIVRLTREQASNLTKNRADEMGYSGEMHEPTQSHGVVVTIGKEGVSSTQGETK